MELVGRKVRANVVLRRRGGGTAVPVGGRAALALFLLRALVLFER